MSAKPLQAKTSRFGDTSHLPPSAVDNVSASQPYPLIRLFAVAEGGALTPQPDIPPKKGSHCTFGQDGVIPGDAHVCNTWQTAGPGITGAFSAICMHTAISLSALNTGAPRIVGLIHASVSGTAMELWSPPEALAKCPMPPATPAPLAPSLDGPTTYNISSELFNAMIAPCVEFSISVLIPVSTAPVPVKAAASAVMPFARYSGIRVNPTPAIHRRTFHACSRYAHIT